MRESEVVMMGRWETGSVVKIAIRINWSGFSYFSHRSSRKIVRIGERGGGRRMENIVLGFKITGG